MKFHMLIKKNMYYDFLTVRELFRLNFLATGSIMTTKFGQKMFRKSYCTFCSAVYFAAADI